VQITPDQSRTLALLRDRPSVAALTLDDLGALTVDTAGALIQQASGERPLGLDARVAAIIGRPNTKRFDPRERRDRHGRWTDGATAPGGALAPDDPRRDVLERFKRDSEPINTTLRAGALPREAAALDSLVRPLTPSKPLYRAMGGAPPARERGYMSTGTEPAVLENYAPEVYEVRPAPGTTLKGFKPDELLGTKPDLLLGFDDEHTLQRGLYQRVVRPYHREGRAGAITYGVLEVSPTPFEYEVGDHAKPPAAVVTGDRVFPSTRKDDARPGGLRAQRITDHPRYTKEMQLAVRSYVGDIYNEKVNGRLRDPASYDRVAARHPERVQKIDDTIAQIDAAMEAAGPLGEDVYVERVLGRPTEIVSPRDEGLVPGATVIDRAYTSTTADKAEPHTPNDKIVLHLTVDGAVKGIWGANPPESELLLERGVRYVVDRVVDVRDTSDPSTLHGFWYHVHARVLPPEAA
jgi:hypothetical protein